MTDNVSNFHIKEGDTSPELKRQLIAQEGEDTPVDVSNANKVGFQMRDAHTDDLVVDELDGTNVTVVDGVKGVVKYSWQDGDTADAGDYEAEFIVEYSDGTTERYPNSGYLVVHILDNVA
jgi:hypothetical protein